MNIVIFFMIFDHYLYLITNQIEIVDTTHKIFDIFMILTTTLLSILVLVIIRTKARKSELVEKLKRTNFELLEIKHRYQSMYETSLDLYSTLDLNDIRIDCNRAYVENLGYKKEEIIGKSIFSDPHIDKDDKMKVKSILESVKQGNSFTDMEFNLSRKDGTKFPVLVNVIPLKDESGKIVGTHAMMRDMSPIYEMREKELNEELIKAQYLELEKIDKQKEEFAAMISHELKTPLAPIKGYCEMLKEPNLMGNLNADQLDAIDQIYDASKKLERIIVDLLDVRKLELNKVKFKKEPFSVDMLLSTVYKEFLPLINEKKIKYVKANVDETIIYSDFVRLTQVFDNLIINAIDFVQKDTGKIEFGSINKDNSIMFYVKDNGIGISIENQKLLFKKFYQVDTGYKRSHRGTGLGLPICKSIVEGIGGTMGVESCLGGGTTFYFEFPKDVLINKSCEVAK